jgi:dihydrofolate reductase
MKLIAIAAIGENRVIGHGAEIPWYIPEDFKFFKKQTTGSSVVMGRKTFESIGKALPNRDNFVITKDKTWIAEDVTAVSSLEEMYFHLWTDPFQTVYIIGGSEIYNLLLPHCDELILSHVNGNHLGDVFFPEFSDKFEETEILKEHEEFVAKKYTRKS